MQEQATTSLPSGPAEDDRAPGKAAARLPSAPRAKERYKPVLDRQGRHPGADFPRHWPGQSASRCPLKPQGPPGSGFLGQGSFLQAQKGDKARASGGKRDPEGPVGPNRMAVRHRHRPPGALGFWPMGACSWPVPARLSRGIFGHSGPCSPWPHPAGCFLLGPGWGLKLRSAFRPSWRDSLAAPLGF